MNLLCIEIMSINLTATLLKSVRLWWGLAILLGAQRRNFIPH
jgi:hypothetical protein